MSQQGAAAAAHSRRPTVSQHLVQIERGAELDAGLDEQAQRLVAVSSRSTSTALAKAPAMICADAHQEVDVLGVVAAAIVVDVEKAHDLAPPCTERHADLALRAGLAVQLALVVAEPRVVGALDHERLATFHGGDRAREERERRGRTGA